MVRSISRIIEALARIARAEAASAPYTPARLAGMALPAFAAAMRTSSVPGPLRRRARGTRACMGRVP
jgi:hypothetical protein